jgi:aspartyl/asparaginyl beta-hydroxylase (cupin superfamily)
MTGSSSIEALVQRAQQLVQAGDRTGALPIWEEILEQAPRHPGALNALGNFALARGNTKRACALLADAVAEEPAQPALRFNYASALKAKGDVEAALQQLNAALAIDPYFVQAIFQKAVLYEDVGQHQSAARLFRDFLDCAPEDIRASEQFRPAMDRATASIRRDDAALAGSIAAMLDKGGHPQNVRVQESIGALIGQGKIYTAEPTFLAVSRLPAIPFFDRGLFGWLERLEAATAEIRSELEQIVNADPNGAEFSPYVANPPGVPLNQWAELDHSSRWSAFHLWRHGQRIDSNCALAPQTAALLETLPLISLTGRAPNAFFSLLKPATRIPPHTGVTNIRSTVHLPLIVPPGCGFRVGAETRAWEAGKAWVFDDTIEHEAWNESDAPRYILIFDIWNPALTYPEQQQFAAALTGYDAHYGQAEAWSGTS